MNLVLLVVTALSVVVAGVASAIAWRAVRDERRRSEARVAALTDAIYAEAVERPVGVPALFERTLPSRSRFKFIAAGACVVTGITVAFFWADPFRVGDSTGLAFDSAQAIPSDSRGMKGPSHKVDGTSSTQSQRPSHKLGVSTDAPLELLELDHERDRHRLIVRGLVRNPANGAERDGLTAVVLAYNRAGDLLASGGAGVLQTKLTAGETTPFVVGVSGADNIERIRLSFRTPARIESHVDRRPHGDARDVEP